MVEQYKENIYEKTNSMFMTARSMYRSVLKLSNSTPELMPNYFVTIIFLNAMILELIIKIFYELDNKKDAVHGHHIDKLFLDLSKTRQELLKAKYNDILLKHKTIFLNQGVFDVTWPTLEETLKSNSYIVVNFKYDSKLQNGNIVQGAFLQDCLNIIEEELSKL